MTLVTIAPLVIACHPSLPVKSVQELIGFAKAKPKELLFASPGVGSIHHLAIEMFNRAAGVSMVHVPYRGGPPAVMDTIGGRVQLVVTTVIPSQAHVKAGKLRVLGVTSMKGGTSSCSFANPASSSSDCRRTLSRTRGKQLNACLRPLTRRPSNVPRIPRDPLC